MLYNVLTKHYSIFEEKIMATINIRIDDELKMESEKVLSELGLGMTAALTIFLKTVVRTNSIPFQLEIPNKQTLKSFDEIEKISSGKVSAKRYTSTAELRKDLKV